MSKTSAGKKQYRSLRGKTVDMDLLRKKNELTPAVGNAKVNARGDELGPGGKIIKSRDQIVNDFYKKNPNTVPDEEPKQRQQSIKNDTKQETKESSLSEEELEMFEEAEEEDEWIEDDSGDFVKKGKK